MKVYAEIAASVSVASHTAKPMIQKLYEGSSERVVHFPSYWYDNCTLIPEFCLQELYSLDPCQS